MTFNPPENRLQKQERYRSCHSAQFQALNINFLLKKTIVARHIKYQHFLGHIYVQPREKVQFYCLIIMIEPSQGQSSDKMDNNSSLLTVKAALFRNYSVHYHHMKRQFLPKVESWKKMIRDLGQRRQGFQCNHILTFLYEIEENDEQHSLSHKQLSLIIKEIVQLLEFERNIVLSEKDNEYQLIFQRNCKMFREFNRINQLKGALNPQRLIGLEIFVYLLQLSEKLRHSRPKIPRLVSMKAITQITKIQQVGVIETFLKSKWEEHYAFLDKQIQSCSFGMLSEIFFLAHIKRKISYHQQNKMSQQFDVLQIPFQKFIPEQKYVFKNSNRFRYKFCQLAGFTFMENNIRQKNYLHKGQINRKMEMILERSQHSDQRFELRALMVQYRLTFKSLSQLVISLTNGISFFPRPQFIVGQLEKCQWSLLNDDRIETNFQLDSKKCKNDSLTILTQQNFIGQSICKIALERFRTYATVLKIQNKLMGKIEKGTSLYIRRLNYSYDHYYSVHHHKDPPRYFASSERQNIDEVSPKEENDSYQQDQIPYIWKFREEKIEYKEQEQQQSQQKDQEEKYRKEQIFTVILGFSEQKIQFAFKYDEQLQQNYYVEHLIKFLKTKHEKSYNIFLSELDFEKARLFEITTARMVQSFRSNFNRFFKFQASPSKFFYHLLIHTFVDKCLNQTFFETNAQFSDLLSRSILKIIKLINFQTQDTQVKIQDQGQNQQEGSCDQFVDKISEDLSPNNKEKGFEFNQFHLKYDQKVIREKIHSIMMKGLSIPIQELEKINWHGKKIFLKKRISCQYYLASKEQNRFKTSTTSEDSISNPVFQTCLGCQSNISDLQRSFLKIFKRQWPFLSNLQISHKLKNLVSFVKHKNTSLNEIKRLLRNITRNLLIYQAYFNELCCSESEISKIIANKYWKQVNYLNSIYSKQIENIEEMFPNMLEVFFEKLLKNLKGFPITSEKIRLFKKITTKKNINPMSLKIQEDYSESFKALK